MFFSSELAVGSADICRSDLLDYFLGQRCEHQHTIYTSRNEESVWAVGYHVHEAQRFVNEEKLLKLQELFINEMNTVRLGLITWASGERGSDLLCSENILPFSTSTVSRISKVEDKNTQPSFNTGKTHQ